MRSFGTWRMNPHTTDEELSLFKDKPLDFESGSKFRVQQLNFEVLGRDRKSERQEVWGSVGERSLSRWDEGSGLTAMNLCCRAGMRDTCRGRRTGCVAVGSNDGAVGLRDRSIDNRRPAGSGARLFGGKC